MSTRTRFSVVALLVVGTAIGLFFQPSGREFTASSFGVIPNAYGALFELFGNLDAQRGRNYAPPAALAPAATVWWFGAPSLCDETDNPDAAPWRGKPWLEAGATAVVFLDDPVGPPCAALAGLPLPLRAGETPKPSAKSAPVLQGVKATPTPGANRWVRLITDAQGGEVDSKIEPVSGDLVEWGRSLDTPGLSVFDNIADWHQRAALSGKPFVIEHAVGRGRLILVADGRFLRNAVLDRGDNAVFAVDLVRAFGVPLFDERERGFRRHDSVVRYLLASSALPLLAGLTVLALLFAWQGRATPLRTVVEIDRRAPVLSGFVDSLAALYRQSSDYPVVLAAYRAVTLARLRRALRLPHDARDGDLFRRLRRHRHVKPAEIQALEQPQPVSSVTGLADEAQRFDRILWEVAGK